MSIMFFGVLANHVLDLLGIVFIVEVAVKMALRYPIKRWFW